MRPPFGAPLAPRTLSDVRDGLDLHQKLGCRKRTHLDQGERTERRGTDERNVLPFGISELDDCLPGGGLALGHLHEVIEAGPAGEYAGLATLFTAGILARLKPQRVQRTGDPATYDIQVMSLKRALDPRTTE